MINNLFSLHMDVLLCNKNDPVLMMYEFRFFN